MSTVRNSRVCELLKRQLGEIIRREFSVSDVGLVTVNDVATGGDLRSATVFLSILGNADQQKRGLTKLEASRLRIQDLMAKSVVLKYTPVLRFVIDDSIVRGNKVLQILDDLEKTNPLPPDQLVTKPKPDSEP
ncbi:MAG: ribosome-binding factor RbfA [Verrucomicrobiota bacterium]|jgi:ribosome-binding factor A